MSAGEETPQIAVWFFVAATFLFAAPTLFFRESDLVWLTVTTFTLGMAAVVFGGVMLGKEMRGRRAGRAGRDG